MSNFEIKDCALLTKMSGIPEAMNLRGLRNRLTQCHLNVLYHHFCETPLVPSFDYPDYRNDFAVWVKVELGDDVLAERLGIIDPYSFPSLEELRLAVVDIIDDRLSELAFVPSVPPGHEFYFMEATTIVFDTGERISHPTELANAISKMTNGSIYFHFLEARWRPPIGVDDFSAWLFDMEGDWTRYLKAIQLIDFPFFTLTELRKELIRVLAKVREI